jgi:effector-binding domain-containing protein
MKTNFLFIVMLYMLGLALNAQEKSASCKAKFNVEIKEIEEIHMVYYEFTGPYMNSFNDFNKLMGYLKTNKVPMGPHALGIFYDDPSQVPEDQLRSEAGYMVQGKVKTGEGFLFKTIPAGKAVSVKYTSMEDIMKAYEAIGKYIGENGIKVKPFSIEIYHSTDPSVIDAEILFLIEE